MVRFCPHELFTNTKADLGPCNKIHDEELKKKFAQEKESYKKSQYMDEFLRFCQRMLTELQARIKKAKERLYLTQNDDALPSSASGQHKETEEKIRLLSQRINALVEEAEQAGCQGNVEQAQGLMKLSEQLREERDQLRRVIMPFLGKDEYSQHQKTMEVCDTCGAFLIVGDAQQRIDDHLMGKQHIGYSRLKSAVDDIMEEKKKFREEREREMEERRKKREKESEERRWKRRGRSRSRSRSRSREKRRKRRSRSRDRSRDRRDRKHRSRSPRDRKKEKERRSRDRDRRKRSRSRDRSSKENGDIVK